MSDPSSKPEQRLEVLEPAVTRGLIARLRIARLLERFPERPVWAAFMFVNGFVTIGLLAAVAMVSHTPFVFPSLGPTAFLLFFTPTSPTASPRHTLYGHAIGILCGYGALLATGLEHAPPTIVAGVDASESAAARMRAPSTPATIVGGACSSPVASSAP